MSIVSNPTIEGYVEQHHIIPRSMGGKDTVSLSARQHFICHWLLTKMTQGDDRLKMISAFSKMCFQDRYGHRYINSHGYRECRDTLMPEIGRRVGLSNKGKPKPAEQIQKMKAGMAGKHKGKKFCNKDGVTRRVPLEEYNQLLKEGWVSGRCLSSNARQKMRQNGFDHIAKCLEKSPSHIISRQRKA